MKIAIFLVAFVALCEAYPGYYPYYGNNYDTLSYGSSDSSRGGMVMSRYFNPNSASRGGAGGMAAIMFKQPEDQYQAPQPSGQYYADRRRQTQEENFYPQQNEVYPAYPQGAEKPAATELTELAEPTERTADFAPTTLRATVVPELAEPEVEEVEETVQKAKKRVSKKKQVKKPVEDDDDEDDYQPKIPAGSFFPMFFGGRAAGGGMPGGATAVANAYSTGRGGVATSHATAYGAPRPDFKYGNN